MNDGEAGAMPTDPPGHQDPQSSQLEQHLASAQGEPTTTLSRNARKRIAKEELRRAKKDERKKLRKERKQLERQQPPLDTVAEDGGVSNPKPKPFRPKPTEVADDDPSRIRIVIDADFEGYDPASGAEFMSQKEFLSLARQLARCYSQNRRAPIPANLSVCGVGSSLKTVLDSTQPDWSRWTMTFNESRVASLYQTSTPADASVQTPSQTASPVVYLTADSPNTLTDLDPTKVYVIGGIVDRNRFKNLCLNRAERDGFETARLPIGEFVQVAGRKVLTVNHVVEIMVKYIETRDWKTAFLHVIPMRKIEPKQRKHKFGDKPSSGAGQADDTEDVAGAGLTHENGGANDDECSDATENCGEDHTNP
ncbi:tRNA methyltransferase 10 [Entophlyctis luteolus]|nr:tRNA methyltransferase 10 [Entophlyctis luteolus]